VVNETELSRRNFVAVTAVTIGCACAAEELLAAEGAAAEGPKGDDKAEKDAKDTGPKQVEVGTVADFAKDGVVDTWSKPNKFFIVRDAGKLYAPTAVCTHKKCTIKIKKDVMTCPCHGSKFTNAGTPQGGPAKVSLYRFGISVNPEGKIVVDKTKTFDEKKWEEAGSFITIPVAPA
jgi:nitrite reductase/ring-hydroxylating ferredoxin subunit